ncbi:hypothetical protein ATE37_08790 [Streptococcus oralis subsp. tigurinus]|uniref:Uncharacterized protein n=1 Tax=Streptococcus oralis subsp. tigurinus TaxID=1077464 RepID=A0A1X0WYR4_STROR|nr:hypothetical protein [Streptococcus oralis]ORJ31839.1 hypothetical protein ATE37_08790 [Streptococcus oralis subsp. tigurinus]
MEQYVTEALVKAGVELTTLVVKGTTTLVNSKVQSLREERNADKLRNTYDEIINELLLEREQALRIAQAYKEEYDRVNIGDDDIEYLHNTLKQVIKLLSSFTIMDENKRSNMNQLVALLNKDTLKTMQLLGFNYKEAIGEPLTEVCSNAIRDKLGGVKNRQNKKTSR